MAVSWVANSDPERVNWGGEAGTPMSITKPAGVVDDDLIVIFFTYPGADAPPAGAWEPTGFTLATGSPWDTCGAPGGGSANNVAWKIADSEPTTWDLQDGADWEQCCIAIVFRGTHATAPLGNIGFFCTLFSGGDELDFPAVTVDNDGSYVLCLGSSRVEATGLQFNPASLSPDTLSNDFFSPSSSDSIQTALVGGSGAFDTGSQGGWTYTLDASTDYEKALMSIEIVPVGGGGSPGSIWVVT